MAKIKTLVGVSWRRLQATPSPERKNVSTPSGRVLRSRTQTLANSNSVIGNVQTKMMGRMTSFRGTLDTLRKVTVMLICNCLICSYSFVSDRLEATNLNLT